MAVRRLPDRLTWSATAGFLVLAAPTVVSGGGSAWLRAVEAAAAVGTALGLCAVAPQRWVGRGDVKYGLAVGAAAGWVSWFALYVALLLATSLAALTGIAMLLARRRSKALPFGPFMFGGALVAVAVLRSHLGG